MSDAAYHLSFDDEFNSFQAWNGTTGWHTADLQGNRTNGDNLQYYADPSSGYNAFSVQSGVLSIKADLTPPGVNAMGKAYVSGMITTATTFSQQYGYFEMRAKMPAGKGFFPAFWIIPSDGGWPPEYDIVEVIGSEPTAVHQTSHWSTTGAAGYTYSQINATTGFHTYGFKWDASNVVWYVDGVATYTQPNFANEPMYLLANLAVGGSWPGAPDATTPFPSAMEIDYIRVYSNDPAMPTVTPQSGYVASSVASALNSSTLPAGWDDIDVGATLNGSASFDGTTWTVNGAGTYIGNNSDQFNFAAQNLTGDGSIIAKVNSLTNTDPWARGGVMMRTDASTTTHNSVTAIFAGVFVTPGNGVAFQWRTSPGATAQATTIAGVTAPSWVKLTRTGNSYAGFYSSDGINWTQIGTAQTVSMSSTLRAGLVVSSHVTTTLATATFTSVSTSRGRFSTLNDIGSPGKAGSAYCADSAYTLTGSGSGIAGGSDSFSFLNKSWSNDGTIVAKITSMSNSNDWAKAGLMFRGSSAANSVFAAVMATPANGVRFNYRETAGGAVLGGSIAAPRPTPTTPVWVKLVRTGNSFAGYYSADGNNWSQVYSSASVSMPGSALVGLALTSNVTTVINKAVFRSVSMPTAFAPSADNDIGNPGRAGSGSFDGTTYTVSGGGVGIANSSDSFNFYNTSWSGDGVLQAKITSMTNTNAWAKTGVMFRESTAADAPFVAVVATPGGGVRLNYRLTTGAAVLGTGVTSVPQPTPSAPLWVKLVRSGDSFGAYYSTDGAAWMQIGTTVQVKLAPVALAGLAVTSNDNAALNISSFTDVLLG